MRDLSSWWRRAYSGLSQLRVREFAVVSRRCPFCGTTLIVRLRRDELGVRCLRCGASAVHLSLGLVLRKRVSEISQCDVCELSARGSLVAFLRDHARSLVTSEYFSDAQPGEFRNGVRCEDVQRLTYADESFDLITHTEVLEHVPDDTRAFSELYRVLRPGGIMLFTVPIRTGADTIEQAVMRDGAIEQLHPPTYHGDPLRAGKGILVFREYGDDIVARLTAAGFARAWIESSDKGIPWGYGRPVVCAVRS
jgi:SAM-dependent methyltransferase